MKKLQIALRLVNKGAAAVRYGAAVSFTKSVQFGLDALCQAINFL